MRELKQGEELPWTLLLNADPDRAIVATYMAKSRVFVAENGDQAILGVLVLMALPEDHHYEIMNVSVDPAHFRQGIGRSMMRFAFADIQARDTQAVIWIKTGDLTVEAIGLYESVGFKIVDVVKDYFIDHYADPIYENGQLLRNQVVMRLGQ
ncbi:GNAT family N-acetyltransferase [Pseudolactococcus reticulitermitis]